MTAPAALVTRLLDLVYLRNPLRGWLTAAGGLVAVFAAPAAVRPSPPPPLTRLPALVSLRTPLRGWLTAAGVLVAVFAALVVARRLLGRRLQRAAPHSATAGDDLAPGARPRPPSPPAGSSCAASSASRRTAPRSSTTSRSARSATRARSSCSRSRW